MSATNIVRQRDAVHVLTDAALYDAKGVLRVVRPKAFAMPNLPAALAARGPGRAVDLLGTGLSSLFATFDDLCTGIEAVLPQLVERCQAELQTGVCDRIELTIAGWSAARSRPESYLIQTEQNDWRPDNDLGAVALQTFEPYKLTELPEIAISPIVAEDIIREAFADAPPADAPDDWNIELHGLAMLELQRSERSDFLGGEPLHLVGGFALLSTVTERGVDQKLLQRWPDRIGEHLQPDSINWPEYWRERNAAAKAAVIASIPEGLSKLQRDRMLKKARKGTLRVV